MKREKKWYKSASNWFMVIASTILILILAANLFIIFQSKTNEDQVPSVFGYSSVVFS